MRWLWQRLRQRRPRSPAGPRPSLGSRRPSSSPPRRGCVRLPLDASCAAARSASSRARSAAAAAAAFCAWSSGFISTVSPPNAFIAMKPPPPTTTRPATASAAKSPALLFLGMGSLGPRGWCRSAPRFLAFPYRASGPRRRELGIAPVGTAGRPWFSAVAARRRARSPTSRWRSASRSHSGNGARDREPSPWR